MGSGVEFDYQRTMFGAHSTVNTCTICMFHTVLVRPFRIAHKPTQKRNTKDREWIRALQDWFI